MRRHSYANAGYGSLTAGARNHNYRIHLTRWAVTAPAERHRSSNHHSGLPGPRRPGPQVTYE